MILRGGAAFLALSAAAACSPAPETEAPSRTEFTIAWSIYAGWMPWPYADQAQIVKKWADKYGLTLNIVQVNDYVESLNQFTAGTVDAVTSTTMDALTIPAAGGVDTSVVIIGDYSNGNDGVVLKGSSNLADIKGRSVNLVELSVSHYLLARALESAGLAPTDVSIVNTSDADIVASYSASSTTALVTWNPQLAEVKAMPNAYSVFDSSAIPGEILDALIVRTEALQSNPDLGKALAGIWYETMALMSAQTPEGAAARAAMGALSGTDQAGYEAQLTTTAMYYTPAEALAFFNSPELSTATDRVRQFSFANGLFGQGATSVDAIGIAFPGGQTLGDAANVKLRFDASYTAMAANGEL
ncbi:MAG: putative urea ABC transporter substrate-binding protein [Hyphomonadaceae bacterium]|nr:putative urea ABC transporter substrate-binding protein [Hyphomonadaceae bacterium]